MNIWLLIIFCGITTYLIRFIPLSGIINIKGSQIYLKIVNLIPIIVLTRSLFKLFYLMIINSHYHIILKFIQAILAIIIAFLFKNVILTVIVGMLFYLTVSSYTW